MIVISVFVSQPDDPGELARTALKRVRAAASRFEGRVEVRTLALDDPLAYELAAAIEPTVAVGDLVVATGTPPPAGHVIRAIRAVLEEQS